LTRSDRRSRRIKLPQIVQDGEQPVRPLAGAVIPPSPSLLTIHELGPREPGERLTDRTLAHLECGFDLTNTELSLSPLETTEDLIRVSFPRVDRRSVSAAIADRERAWFGPVSD
jgi:hypothetical protein